MNENETQDQLDQPATDQLDAGLQDELQAPAGDQLDQDAGDQLDAGDSASQDVQDAGDGETTGDENVAPAFPDDAPAGDDQDDELAVTQPHPYVSGFGITGKFDGEAAPSVDAAGDVVQDDQAPQDDQ